MAMFVVAPYTMNGISISNTLHKQLQKNCLFLIFIIPMHKGLLNFIAIFVCTR